MLSSVMDYLSGLSYHLWHANHMVQPVKPDEGISSVAWSNKSNIHRGKKKHQLTIIFSPSPDETHVPPDKTVPDTTMMQSAALHGRLGESVVALFCAVAKRRAAREPALSPWPLSSRRPPASPINVIWSREGPRHSLHKRLQGSPPLRGQRHGWDYGFDYEDHSGKKKWSSAALAGMWLKAVIGFLLIVLAPSAMTVFFWWREGEEGLLFVKLLPDCL